MGWQDSITNTVFTIQTGDGKKYTPLWQPGETEKDFNFTKFDYINLPGSFIDRKQVGARNFPMVFFFQGDDCIAQASAFDTSANDPRLWVIHHPYYGNITGQPTKLKRNDKAYNVTEFTLDFWESIVVTQPSPTISVTDNVAAKQATLLQASPVDYSTKVNIKPADVSTITAFVNQVNGQINKVLQDVDYTSYKNTVTQALNDVNNMETDAATGIGSVEATLLAPALFAQSVQNRVAVILPLFEDLLALATVTSRNNNCFFEAAGAAIVASYVTASVNPNPGDYVTRTDVLSMQTGLNNLYSQYLTMLDTLYNASVDPTIGYVPSQPTQDALQDLVLAAMSGLQILAFNAKQIRTVITDKDDNLIVLTQRYMGLDTLDANIDTFRQINDIKNNNLYLVRKGTTINYYV